MCGCAAVRIIKKVTKPLLSLALHQIIVQYKCKETEENCKLFWSKGIACAALCHCRLNEVASFIMCTALGHCRQIHVASLKVVFLFRIPHLTM